MGCISMTVSFFMIGGGRDGGASAEAEGRRSTSRAPCCGQQRLGYSAGCQQPTNPLSKLRQGLCTDRLTDWPMNALLFERVLLSEILVCFCRWVIDGRLVALEQS